MIPGYNGVLSLVMSFAGISGRYSFAVQGGSTMWPIFTNSDSMFAGTCAVATPAASQFAKNAPNTEQQHSIAISSKVHFSLLLEGHFIECSR